MKRAIIVHGFKGTPDTNWKPWLKKELEAQGFSVEVPDMPNTEHPNASEWVSKLDETVGDLNDGTIYLIGHSLGCITILKYLETLTGNQHIYASVFVAGFTREFKEYSNGHDSFFEKELDFDGIKKHCDTFTAIHSEDDSNVGFEELAMFKEKLDARVIAVNGFGHFGSANGVFEVPVVLDAVLSA
ncbi:MAG: alpha/beta fold hydrolase [Patescibacteria group bacterium]